MANALMAGAVATRFLSRFWQKRPLVIREVVGGLRNLVTWNDLAALAARDDVESRLVVREGSRWSLQHGPFRRRDLVRLPERNWTLLVQGVNLHVPAGDALLRRFSFIPHARLDDLMVSYAAPGGGVGPHVDSYDVFLLQGEGRRRWRVGRQRDLTLKSGLPLKILARFRPQHECLLGPGDMLYLPPEIAHDGVAIDECSTYSVGFRAPSAQELATGFLDWLRDSLVVDGRYRDPDIAASRAPARIGADVQAYAQSVLERLTWNRRVIARFLGAYLTEPKPSVGFTPPRRPRSLKAFADRARRNGVSLDSRTQLLYDATHFYVNGDILDPPAGARTALRQLANSRELPARVVERPITELLYRWYCDGFLHLR